MKRVGNLWPRIAERDNLLLAFHKAARGKADRREVVRFRADLEENIGFLRRALLHETYTLGDFHRFTVFDPKERVIHAAAFPERVIHHAVMNVCGPLLDRRMICHSYAGRQGKGQYLALEQARNNACRFACYLKLDIRKYFDSIPHELLLESVFRVFKDPALMRFWHNCIVCYSTEAGRGIPIGSLTSQHLANHYLSPLDQWIQAQPACCGYVRYMDDFVVWSHDSVALRKMRADISGLLREQLGLELKSSGVIQRSGMGMDFLGYRVFPDRLQLNARSWRRFQRKLRNFLGWWTIGWWDDAALARHLHALLAFVGHARTGSSLQRFYAHFGASAIGLEPCQPRRQLEQQRGQLPLREPQLQHAGQPQQQPRFPSGPQLQRATGGSPWMEPAVVPFHGSIRGCEQNHHNPSGLVGDGGCRLSKVPAGFIFSL